MISSRRVTHRHVFVGLAFLIPTLLAVGLLLRPEVPPISLPDPLLLDTAGFATHSRVKLKSIQVGEHEFNVGIEIGETKLPAMLIRSVSPPLKPDLLVYWASDSEVQGNLPEDALLVGELAGKALRRMVIPEAAVNGQGTMLIFSLPHQEIVGQFTTRSALDLTAS